MSWNKIGLIGLGLLGGSLGLAIKARLVARRVEGYVRRPASIVDGLNRQVADHISNDLGQIVTGADLIVLATPVPEMAAIAQAMVPFLRPAVLVTDVGSVKDGLVQTLEQIFGRAGANFVGAHPMAGAEKNGMRHARANLFEKAVCVLTPTEATTPELLAQAASFWQAVGATPLKLAPALHDEMVGRSSHLPHLLAAQLANYVLDPARPKEQAMLCAGGFRDTTRIASGPPEMWRDILLANREHLSRSIGEVIGGLETIRGALEREDGKMIGEFLEKAKQRRDHWCAPGDSPNEISSS